MVIGSAGWVWGLKIFFLVRFLVNFSYRVSGLVVVGVGVVVGCGLVGFGFGSWLY